MRKSGALVSVVHFHLGLLLLPWLFPLHRPIIIIEVLINKQTVILALVASVTAQFADLPEIVGQILHALVVGAVRGEHHARAVCFFSRHQL